MIYRFVFLSFILILSSLSVTAVPIRNALEEAARAARAVVLTRPLACHLPHGANLLNRATTSNGAECKFVPLSQTSSFFHRRLYDWAALNRSHAPLESFGHLPYSRLQGHLWQYLAGLEPHDNRFVPWIDSTNPERTVEKLIARGAKEERFSFMGRSVDRFRGTTTVPISLVTMFAPTEDLALSSWFLNLLEVFRYPTTGDYRNAVAIPSYWANYSRLGFAYIPEGSSISMRFGPASPQSHPNFSSLFSNNYPSPEELNAFLDRGRNPIFLSLDRTNQELPQPTPTMGTRAMEALYGGGIQVLVDYAMDPDGNRIPIRDLNALYRDGTPFTDVYPSQARFGNTRYWPKKSPTANLESHLLDPKYNDIEINIPLAMFNAGTINTEQFQHLEFVMKRLRAREVCDHVLGELIGGLCSHEQAITSLRREARQSGDVEDMIEETLRHIH